MTLPLPKVVIPNPARVGPARLTPLEEKALKQILDPTLRRAIGEILLTQRGAQENFDELAQQFPIQLQNLANEARLDKLAEEAEPGQVLSVNEEGLFEWVKGGGGETPGERGEYEVIELEPWAKKAGDTQLIRFVPITFQPTTAIVFAVASGTKTGEAALTAEGWFSGVRLELGSTFGASRPACTFGTLPQQSSSLGNALAFGGSPRCLKLRRSAAMAEQCAVKLWVVLFAWNGVIRVRGSGSANNEVGGTLNTTPALEADGASVLRHAFYSRDTANLPVEQSDIALVNTLAEYAAGKEGAAGLQIRFPTKAEKEAGSTYGFNWTFPNEVSNLAANVGASYGISEE